MNGLEVLKEREEVNEKGALSEKDTETIGDEVFTEEDGTEVNVEESVGEETVIPEEKSFGEFTVAGLYELSGEFPNENVAEDIMSDAFRIFAGNRKGEMKDIYSDYLSLKKAFSKSEPARGLSGQKERFHSGFGTPSAKSATSGLTARQMEIARNAGMSYREYADILGSIPAKRMN